MIRILIKNGLIPNGNIADVLIEGEKISAVEHITGEIDGAEIIDASGTYVLPGGIDPHTHVNLKIGDRRVSDGWEAATMASIYGGTTCIIEHPSFGPDKCSIPRWLKETVDEAQGKSYVDYGIHAVFQRVNEQVLNDIPDIVRGGFSSGKVYMTYSGRLNDEDFIRVLEEMGKCGGLTAVHAENDIIISYLSSKLKKESPRLPINHAHVHPDYCEAEAVTRAIALARAAVAPVYIVHLSSADGLEAVRNAKNEGVQVYAETCPQYLFLTEDKYMAPDGINYIMAPPLRRENDVEALWHGICDGTIDTVGTDHCSFSHIDKVKYSHSGADILNAPGGVPGIETRIPLLFSRGFMKNKLSLQRFVQLVSEAPAKLFGIKNKGKLERGMDADIVIIKPSEEYTISNSALHQKVDYTPFESMRINCKIPHVFLRGKHIISNYEFIGEKSGTFIRREPFYRFNFEDLQPY